LFNLKRGMQMVQHKNVGAGLALVFALSGMGISSTASALPEMEVGSHVVATSDLNRQVQSDDSSLANSDDSADQAGSDADTDSTSN
jgi:hypothetical protein